MLAIRAEQIGFPAFVVLNTAASFAGIRVRPERCPLLPEAIGRGGAFGLQGAPDGLPLREAGWDRPMAEGHRQLGLKPPVRNKAWSLAQQLSDLAEQL